MDDLSLNFAVTSHDAPTQLRRPLKAASGGKWTSRVKSKQKLKRLSKPVVASAEPSPVAEQQQLQLPPAPPKKAFISSLFTSLPLIKNAHVEPEVDQAAITAPSNAPSLSSDFASLGIMPQLAERLHSSKFNLQTPTSIQKAAIPKLLSTKHDAILQAQTGSGKTIAYLIPIIQDLLAFGKQMQDTVDRSVGTLAIVLVPTRELAQQVYNVAVNLMAFPTKSEDEHTSSHWLVPGVLSGGMSRQHEKARLRKGCPLLVATPGRLLDHLEGTKSFRLAGEQVKKPKHSLTKFANEQDEFQVEDAPFEKQDGESESEEDDYTSKPTARSYRSRPLKKMANLFGLRWLVLDEADRLMDMGFEPQIQKVIAQLSERSKIVKRRSVLCSATMQGKVQKLAGYALNDPQIVKQDEPTDRAIEALQHGPPSQLKQSYIVVPEKLRFVTLIALLRQQLKLGKVIVFMSATSCVDFHYHALAGLKMGRHGEDEGSVLHHSQEEIAATCPLFPHATMFRLHGNLDLPTRLTTLKQFTSSKTNSVLLTTSVAGRGLDIPFVKCVIQLDLPTEGGVSEYVHRIGRTARAGAEGEAWTFLMPSETAWVKWAEAKMNAKPEEMQYRIKEVPVESVLTKGFGSQDYETRSTDVQMAFERWAEVEANSELARLAFVSHVRAYATHPAEEKSMFHIRNLHLGHLAKAFALRYSPKELSKLVGRPVTSIASTGPKTTPKRVREADEEDSEVEELKRGVKQPRTGRALEGKGLRAAPINSKSEFNIG